VSLVGAKEAGRRSGKSRRTKAEKRRDTVLALHASGLGNAEIAKRLSVSLRTIQRDLGGLEETLDSVDEALAGNPVSAGDLHLRLTDLLNLDVADLLRDDGKYKPVKQWPRLWRQLFVVPEVREIFERSKDGGASSWDQVGTVTKLSRLPDILKVIELAARLKTVDAFKQGNDAKEVASEIMSEIDIRIAEGRKRAVAYAESLKLTDSSEVIDIKQEGAQ